MPISAATCRSALCVTRHLLRLSWRAVVLELAGADAGERVLLGRASHACSISSLRSSRDPVVVLLRVRDARHALPEGLRQRREDQHSGQQPRR